MARVTIEDCLDSIDNRFALVMLASKRARQIENGAQLLIEGGAAKNKMNVKALREIAAGKIAYDRDVATLLDDWNPRKDQY